MFYTPPFQFFTILHNTIVRNYLFIFLFLSFINPLLSLPQNTKPEFSNKELTKVYNIKFGDSEEQIITGLFNNFNVKVSKSIQRDSYTILEFKNIRLKSYKIDILKVYINNNDAVFLIEEEIYSRWDLQKEDRENLAMTKDRLNRILKRLRNRYGREFVSEDVNLSVQFQNVDFVIAAWQFKENRWIHLIFEPQDWYLKPELNKFIIIYRDSNRDIR